MNRIKLLREEMRMTQVKLSTELGVSQETVSAYESGKHYPSIPNLLKMSELFSASCDYILGISDIRTIMTGIDGDDDIMLLSRYHNLSPMERTMVKAYIQALEDKRNFQ